jgi:hypothetical protein
MHSIAARLLIVVASVYTALLQLFSPTSLAYRAAGDGWLIDAVNVLVLCLSGIALADLIWRDVLNKGLILPGIRVSVRHQLCVATYSALASAFAVRAFVASSGEWSAVWQVGSYYLLIAAGIAVEAAAIANEERQECRTDSSKD